MMSGIDLMRELRGLALVQTVRDRGLEPAMSFRVAGRILRRLILHCPQEDGDPPKTIDDVQPSDVLDFHENGMSMQDTSHRETDSDEKGSAVFWRDRKEDRVKKEEERKSKGKPPLKEERCVLVTGRVLIDESILNDAGIYLEPDKDPRRPYHFNAFLRNTKKAIAWIRRFNPEFPLDAGAITVKASLARLLWTYCIENGDVKLY